MARIALLLEALLVRARAELLTEWILDAFKQLYVESYSEGYKDGREDALGEEE